MSASSLENRDCPGFPKPGLSRFSGFTLIELLVALAIFAILSTFAYRSLNVMLEGRERLQAESRKWRDIAMFVGRIERDLRAVADRNAVAPLGTPLAPVSSAVTIAAQQGTGLAVTRMGNAIQENLLAAPQRVAYMFRDGHVDRFAWSSVDAAPRDEPTPVTVLRSVRSLEFRFLSKNEWRTTWGLPGSPDRIPAAVEMTLTLDSGERIVRLVDFPIGVTTS
jgi:general secretion pathway protein J